MLSFKKNNLITKLYYMLKIVIYIDNDNNMNNMYTKHSTCNKNYYGKHNILWL